MTDINTLFVKASRAKLRISTARGQLSIEDLWDLPLQAGGQLSLDNVAKALHRQLKQTEEEISFVTPVGAKSNGDSEALEIVKHIISVKIVERDKAALRREKAQKRQLLLEQLALRDADELKAAPREKLLADLAALDDDDDDGDPIRE